MCRECVFAQFGRHQTRGLNYATTCRQPSPRRESTELQSAVRGLQTHIQRAKLTLYHCYVQVLNVCSSTFRRCIVWRQTACPASWQGRPMTRKFRQDTEIHTVHPPLKVSKKNLP